MILGRMLEHAKVAALCQLALLVSFQVVRSSPSQARMASSCSANPVPVSVVKFSDGLEVSMRNRFTFQNDDRQS